MITLLIVFNIYSYKSYQEFSKQLRTSILSYRGFLCIYVNDRLLTPLAEVSSKEYDELRSTLCCLASDKDFKNCYSDVVNKALNIYQTYDIQIDTKGFLQCYVEEEQRIENMVNAYDNLTYFNYYSTKKDMEEFLF